MSAKVRLFVCLIPVLAVLAGCAPNQQPAPAQSDSQAQTAGAEQAKEPLGRYYDFEDIQVPASLKLDKARSLLFRVSNFKCGLLVFTENLDAESLINYFVETMAKDNWVMKSAFKYPESALFFAKKGKTAVIRVKEKSWTTEVEIWVAPTL